MIGLLIGYINESIFKQEGFRMNYENFIFNIYGWFLVLITLLTELLIKGGIKYNKPIDYLITLPIVFTILILFECIAGQISHKWYKMKTWDYNNLFKFTICDGYVSLIPTIFFTIGVMIYIYLYINITK
jgi:uncharacterized membrane protein